MAGLLFGVIMVSIFSGGTEGIAHPYEVETLMKNISIWSILSGLAFGILFILFEKGFVILYTSAVGAYLLMTQLNATPALFYGMFLIGTVVQLWMSKGKKVKNMQIIDAKTGS